MVYLLKETFHSSCLSSLFRCIYVIIAKTVQMRFSINRYIAVFGNIRYWKQYRISPIVQNIRDSNFLLTIKIVAMILVTVVMESMAGKISPEVFKIK